MGTRDSIPAPLRLDVSGRAAARDAIEAARAFAEAAGVDGDRVARLVVVVEELITNLYEHGGLRSDETVCVELAATADELTLTITDSGHAFDPLSARTGDAVPARGGGAGIKLVRAWASQIEYCSADGRNRLLVRLPAH